MAMSTALRLYRNMAVTALPIVVADPPAGTQDEKTFNWWDEGAMDWGEFDYIPLPPHAAASVVRLDKRVLRKLEQEFDVKLSGSELADILGFAKMIDAVRLGGDRRAKELALAYLQKAHGRIIRDLDIEFWCPKFFMALCTVARLGIIYPKAQELPQIAIIVPNLIEGLKLQIVLSLSQSRAAAHCEHCGNAYIRHTQEQKFCSERCNSRERQARYRAKLQGRAT
jgi:hypothetical protein